MQKYFIQMYIVMIVVSFLETFREMSFKKEIGNKYEFVQDNHSRSSKGVLRGLHIQKNLPQGKLVRVSHGKVFDVAVDLRPQSPTFGKWDGVILNDIDHTMFWIPPGFAHGFLVLSEIVDFVYKCTEYYSKDDELTIAWDDPDIGIIWPENQDLIISDRDKNGLSLTEYLSK